MYSDVPPVEVSSCARAAGIEDDGKVNFSSGWRGTKSWNYHNVMLMMVTMITIVMTLTKMIQFKII